MKINIKSALKNHATKGSLSSWNLISLTFGFLTKEEKFWVFVLAVLGIVVSAFDAMATLSVLPLISLIVGSESAVGSDYVIRIRQILNLDSDGAAIDFFGLASLLIVTLSVLLNFLNLWIIRSFRLKCQNRLAERLLKLCVNAQYKWLLSQNSKRLSHHVFNDVMSWSSGGLYGLINLIGHISLLLVVAFIILSSAQLAGLFGLLIVGFIAFILMTVLRPKIKIFSKSQRLAAANSLALASEMICGIKDVKLSNRANIFVSSYVKTFAKAGHSMSMLKILHSIPPVMMLYFGQIGVVLIALLLWHSGLSTSEITSQMALVLLLTARAIPALNRLAGDFSTLWSAAPSIQNIQKICVDLDELNAEVFGDETSTVNFIKWDAIKFKNVSFCYEDNNFTAIANINLEFLRGCSYGIVGPSGAGKTTLVDLLLGLLIPTEGCITVGDESLTKQKVKNWQKKISYVPQSPLIMDTSILANVAFGIPRNEIDIERVERCLDMANANDLVQISGLDKDLGEAGKLLSGGERQRLAIARALYSEPEVLVLDEATSAMDNITEKNIKDTLSKICGEVTQVMIAHRLSTIRECDQILVLEKGKLVGRGRYSDLLGTSRLFSKLATEEHSPRLNTESK